MKALKYNSYGKILCHLDMLEELLDFQVQEGEFLLKDIEADDAKQYVDTNTLDLVEFPNKPDNYSIWNWETKTWEPENLWLDKAKADAIKQINQAASQKILSKYPIYKQLNLARTDEAQVMYSWIDNIRNLSNIANANIETSTTLEQINSIVDNFKTELGN